MNFFEHQRKARKKTSLFILLFILALFCISLAFYFIIVFLLKYSDNNNYYSSWWYPNLFIYVFTITTGFISIVSLVKILILKTGAETIAKSVGGKKIDETTKDPNERKLLNIIEEMSIASGCPIPKVYILDNERGINAFAAGFSINDSVIAVTRGALENLSRNELQGVIAHEYSHILNGDMKINLRLVGFLFGIFSLIILGQFILRASAVSKGKKDKGNAVLILLAIALIIIGYIGFFFGRLIQAAISRQREYLADASAVQFTRDPTSIGGALLKIALLEEGSKLKTHAASQISHMLFSAYDALAGLLATHPPIHKRIERVCPELVKYLTDKKILTQYEPTKINFEFYSPLTNKAFYNQQFTKIVGSLNSDSIEKASAIINQIPEPIRNSFHINYELPYIIYSLFLSHKPQVYNEQINIFTYDNAKIQYYYKQLYNYDINTKLAIIEITCNKLHSTDSKQKENILSEIKKLILLDKEISFYEFALYSLIAQRLIVTKNEKTIKSINECKQSILIYLGIIAFAGEPENINKAYNSFISGLKKVNLQFSPDLKQFIRKITPENFNEALNAINNLSSTSLNIRKKIIDAIYTCITYDKLVTENELILLRTAGIILQCPVPLVF
ncbi:MAG: M48 family metallopeptidase [Bacteroidales bacterium]|nr:M48 family metallopeptidase [Bacteroidales bacterium]